MVEYILLIRNPEGSAIRDACRQLTAWRKCLELMLVGVVMALIRVRSAGWLISLLPQGDSAVPASWGSVDIFSGEKICSWEGLSGSARCGKTSCLLYQCLSLFVCYPDDWS